MQELPTIAPASCCLDAGGLRAQGERYEAIARGATSVVRSADWITAELGADIDDRIVDELIAVERACCPFFTLDYDRPARSFRIGVSDPAHTPDLDAIEAALRTH